MNLLINHAKDLFKLIFPPIVECPNCKSKFTYKNDNYDIVEHFGVCDCCLKSYKRWEVSTNEANNYRREHIASLK